MPISELLANYGADRLKLLRQLPDALAGAEGVRLAYLYGSLGRGDADSWSDIDVVVVLDRAAVEDTIEDRVAFPARLATPCYVLDSPWNAPLAGAQVNALYVGSSGLPVYVDWNLWPEDMSSVPRDGQVIYIRPGVDIQAINEDFSAVSTYERQRRPEPDEMGEDWVRHARFGMLPIAAKFFARQQVDRLQSLLRGIGGSGDLGTPPAQVAVIRERLQVLGAGQRPDARKAVAALVELAELRVLGTPGNRD